MKSRDGCRGDEGKLVESSDWTVPRDHRGVDSKGLHKEAEDMKERSMD